MVGMSWYMLYLKLTRLGWSISVMFYKPILAALGPEFLFLDPR